MNELLSRPSATFVGDLEMIYRDMDNALTRWVDGPLGLIYL
jgi:hypothetical protein